MTTRTMTPPAGYRLAGTVGSLIGVRGDPCARFEGGEFWLAARTPDGPGTLRLGCVGGELTATAYGPGAAWLAEHADAIAGLRDDLGGFTEMAARHPLVARLARTFAGVRMPATGLMFHRLLRAVLEQKVSGKEAHHSYRRVVRHFGEPAPGPAGLTLPPDPAAVAATPYWVFHPFGVEQRRTQALLRAAVAAERLERCADTAEATRRLTALPGIGPWTAAEVMVRAAGDPDAVSVGDFHLRNLVAFTLAGEIRGTDERMLELLEPWRGQRARVIRLLETSGLRPPAFGPRYAPRSIAAI